MTRASETSMSNEQRRATCFETVCSRLLSRVVTTRAYLAPRKKNKKKTRKRPEEKRKNERRRNPYVRIRRYKITSTLRLLRRGDPQDEGLRRLQPRAQLSKLDYFYAGTLAPSLALERPPKDRSDLQKEPKL